MSHTALSYRSLSKLDSGGILKALDLRKVLSPGPLQPIPVDLHPNRPIRRGIAPPPKRIPIANLPIDPTFEEINGAGGRVDLHDEDHEIVGRDGKATGVGVSGEIKRTTPFEVGLPGAVTWMEEDGKGGWFTDEVSMRCDVCRLTVQLIMDERYVVIDIKGKGLVIFSSCVNSAFPHNLP